MTRTTHTKGTIHISLPWIPPAEVRGNSRAHWAKKSRTARLMRQSGYLYGTGKALEYFGYEQPFWVGKTYEKVRVTYEFRHWRSIDGDNLFIGIKNWFDGFVEGSNLVPDDSPEHVQYGEHRFVKVPKSDILSSETLVEIEVLA